MIANILAVVLLALVTTSAMAHHQPEHRIVAIGVETEITVTVMVCDTQDAADLILAAHREQGLEMAMAVIAHLRATPSPLYSGEGLCGPAQGRITVHEQHSANIMPEGVIYLVSMSLKQSSDRVYFGLIMVDDILPASRANELTANPA